MSLNLTSLTLPKSTLLDAYVGFHSEMNISLVDAEAFFAHLNKLPNAHFEVSLRANSAHTISSVDAKWLRDNGGASKPLNIYANITTTLLAKDLENVNQVLESVIVVAETVNVANLATGYLQPAHGTGAENVLAMLGLSLEVINLWTLGWPDVQGMIKARLGSF